MDEAREYIAQGNIEKAIKIYNSIEENKLFSDNERANAKLFQSMIFLNSKKNQAKAENGFLSIINDFKNTDAAGDALFFLSLIQEEKGNDEKSIFYLKKFHKEHKEHIRFNRVNAILKKKIIIKSDKTKLRVLLTENEKISLSSSKSIFSKQDNINSKYLSIKISNSRDIIINGLNTRLKRITLFSGSEIFNFNGKKYFGEMELVSAAGKISLINIIDVKNYLRSVVPSEMPPSWDMEALKAQAVISRTYAQYMAEQNKNNLFHLKSNVLSQVYKGVEAVNQRSDKAIKDTDSRILTYNGKPAFTAFHSNSGGVTEDPYFIWDFQYPYLKTTRDRFSPAGIWKQKISFKTISKKLFTQKNIKIKSIKITTRTESGRVKNMIIKTDKNYPVHISGKKFREKMGINFIKSTFFQLTQRGQYIRLTGKGYGHGAGLSQWGAKKMAEKGYGYKDIIDFYYSGMLKLTNGEKI